MSKLTTLYMSKLTTLYQDILSYCSMKVNGEDEVDVVLDDDTKPALIEGRRIVMPTTHHLKNYHPDKVVVFHPLQEYIDRGESEVVKKLRHHLNVRINYTTFTIATALLKLVNSPKLHRDLDPEQRELIRAISTIDDKTEANFVDFVLKYYAERSNRFFTSIYLKKAGTYQGKKHARVGVVSFPIYDLLKDRDVKMRPVDREAFKALLAFMFPDSEENIEAYNSYSDSNDAPWLDTLLRTSYNLTQRLNELLALYGTYIDDADSFVFNVNWLNGMDNIDQYRVDIRRIPSQKGNEGTVEKEGEKERSTISAARPTPPPASKQESSAYLTAPPPIQPPQYPQMPYQPVPQMGYPQQPPGYQQAPPPGYPPVGYPPVGYPQHQQQQPAPGLQMTESGKLDFRSVEATNPMVAMAGMVSTPITEWQRQQQAPQPSMYLQQGYVDPRLAYADPRLGGHIPMQGYQQPGMYPQQGYVDPRYAGAVDPRFQIPAIRNI